VCVDQTNGDVTPAQYRVCVDQTNGDVTPAQYRVS